jgi:hypothetical protein
MVGPGSHWARVEQLARLCVGQYAHPVDEIDISVVPNSRSGKDRRLARTT